jgi:hypothetical protein
MSVLMEYMDRLIGQYATPVGEKGEWKIVRTRMDKQVLMVIVETPDGEREFKAHECFIFNPPKRVET